MAGAKTETYLAAQTTMRAHPEWTDQEVADHLNVRLMAMAATIAEARRELELDGTLPPGSGSPAGKDPAHPLGRRRPTTPPSEPPTTSTGEQGRPPQGSAVE